MLTLPNKKPADDPVGFLLYFDGIKPQGVNRTF